MATAVAAAALLAAGCGTGATSAAASVTAPGTTTATSGTTTKAPAPTGTGGGDIMAACSGYELTAVLIGGDAGAGSQFWTLLLANTHTQPCVLEGFPTVSYVTGDDGQEVGPPAATTGEPGEGVIVPPGRAAGVDLRLVNVQNFDPAVCEPTPVRGLRITPPAPGDTAALFLPLETTGCAGTPPGPQMEVTTFTLR